MPDSYTETMPFRLHTSYNLKLIL